MFFGIDLQALVETIGYLGVFAIVFGGDVEREKYKSSVFVFPSRGRQKSFFTREDSFWFSRARVEDARKFSERYGAKAIIFARFIPAVRTFIPIIAGVGTMHYGKFLTYNIMGGILWGSSIPLIREYFAHRKQK